MSTEWHTTAVEALRGKVGHDVEVARRPPLARIEQMGRPDGLDPLGARARDLWVPVHLGGGPSGNLASVFPPFFKQVAWGSESRYRALLHHRTTSYQAPTSGTAYTDHGKVTFRAREVRASGGCRKASACDTGVTGVGKGLTLA